MATALCIGLRSTEGLAQAVGGDQAEAAGRA